MKNVLNEMSPSDIILWGKDFVYPYVRDGVQSARRSVQRVAKTGQPKVKAIKAEIFKALKKDPTAFGDAVRFGEIGRQIGGVSLLQQAPPLPTPDTQSISQFANSVKGFLGNANAREKTAQNAKRSLRNPIGSLKDFLVTRATANTYAGSNLTNYTGLYGLINGIPVDNSSMMVPLTSAGIDGQGLIDIVKSTKDAYLGRLRNAGRKIKKYSFFKQ